MSSTYPQYNQTDQLHPQVAAAVGLSQPTNQGESEKGMATFHSDSVSTNEDANILPIEEGLPDDLSYKEQADDFVDVVGYGISADRRRERKEPGAFALAPPTSNNNHIVENIFVDEISNDTSTARQPGPVEAIAVKADPEWYRWALIGAVFFCTITAGVLVGVMIFGGTDEFRGDSDDNSGPATASREITLPPTLAPSASTETTTGGTPTTLPTALWPTTISPTTTQPTQTPKCFDNRSEISFALIIYNGNYQEQAITKYGEIRSWCVSRVTDFSELFRDLVDFNEPLDGWDVSNALTLAGMFQGASGFNQPLSAWNITSVRDISRMFQDAVQFNSDISSWQTSSVTTTSYMFSGASNFDQNVTAWDVSSVTSMEAMFMGATAFNGDISTWNVTLVINMSFMFSGASSFDGDISQWNVTSVVTMQYMFEDAASFGGNIAGWDVPPGTDVTGMFDNATSFDGNVTGWPVVAKLPTMAPVSSPTIPPNIITIAPTLPQSLDNMTTSTEEPIINKTEAPSLSPTTGWVESSLPSESPTRASAQSTVTTSAPTTAPSFQNIPPTLSVQPSAAPSEKPTIALTPSVQPSAAPSDNPTSSVQPSAAPSDNPTLSVQPSI